MDDVAVIGSMAAFGIVYCHQSVELGIFAVNPSLLPYVILGILLGRINYIKDRSLYQKQIELNANDQIMTLYTCSYEFENARTIVHSKLISKE